MSNAVLTNEIATISSVLEKTKTLMTINAWVRDYPELMYVGLYLPNMFSDGGKLKNGGLTYAEQKQLNFKTLGALESTLTVNENEVVWYEAGIYTEEADITAANATPSNQVQLNLSKIKFFKVGDVVAVKPGISSTTPSVQAKITAIDTTTGVITLDTTVVCEVGDRVIFLYNSITYGSEITRGTSAGDVVPVRTYFQTFGESVSFNSNELNQTRLLVDSQNFVKEKFSVAINSTNNRFAKAFYTGRNIAGTQSETQGLDAVIEEVEARDGAGSAIVDFSGITTSKDKALKLVETINRASSSPVYNGGEVPTAFCNYEAITSLSKIKFDMANYFTLEQKEIEFGIQAYTSPFFRGVQFIVSNTLNRLEPNKSVIYLFPRHLITFKTPQYQSVNEMGALITTKVGGYNILKIPQVSPDIVKYTAQMRIANIFAGQSFSNTYLRLENI